MNKPKNKNICGFICRKIDGRYAYPRSKIYKILLFVDKLVEAQRKYTWESWYWIKKNKHREGYLPQGFYFKYKNRYYCYIDELFKIIYSNAYKSRFKRSHLFYNGIRKIVKKVKEKRKVKQTYFRLWKIAVAEKYKQKFLDKELLILKNKGKDSKIVYNKESDMYELKYTEHKDMGSNLEKITKKEEIYEFKYCSFRSKGKYTMIMVIGLEKNSHYVCLLCKKKAIYISDYHNQYSEECNRCSNGMYSCGRDCTEIEGEISGFLIKCINCKNHRLDITKNWGIVNYQINDKLEEKYNYERRGFLTSVDLDKFNTYKSNLSPDELKSIVKARTAVEKAAADEKKRQLRYNKIRPLFELIESKLKLVNSKLIYKKYKGQYLINVFLNHKNYIRWLIAHGFELDTYKSYNDYGYSQKVIKKKTKVESEFTKILRFIMNIPKYPCDQPGCSRYAMYGNNNEPFPFKCHVHKYHNHKIVLQTKCRGIDGICPYGCKTGNIKYDNFCTYCFCHLFPDDKRTKNIRSKSKEIEVINHICLTHTGKWYHDQPLYVNYENKCCPSRRRIDLRQLIGNTMLCIEIDENQHKYYTHYDEFKRYNEILCDFTCKYIFIRYNPDKYIKNGKKYNPNIKKRLARLDRVIKKQILRIKNNKNTDLLEIKHLYYDK